MPREHSGFNTKLQHHLHMGGSETGHGLSSAKLEEKIKDLSLPSHAYKG